MSLPPSGGVEKRRSSPFLGGGAACGLSRGASPRYRALASSRREGDARGPNASARLFRRFLRRRLLAQTSASGQPAGAPPPLLGCEGGPSRRGEGSQLRRKRRFLRHGLLADACTPSGTRSQERAYRRVRGRDALAPRALASSQIRPSVKRSCGVIGSGAGISWGLGVLLLRSRRGGGGSCRSGRRRRRWGSVGSRRWCRRS